MYPDTLHRPETVIFDGITYRLMGGRRLYYLSQSTLNSERKGAKGLHVAIWEHANGRPVPKKYQVHHLDLNPFNNTPDNLEPRTIRDHKAAHPLTGLSLEKQLLHLDRVRHMTAAWHSSPEGIEWHKKNAVEVWKRRATATYACLWCKKSFAAKWPALYCRAQCGYRHRRSQGHYDVTKECVVCGTAFRTVQDINPSRTRQTCSRTCAVKARAITMGHALSA